MFFALDATKEDFPNLPQSRVTRQALLGFGLSPIIWIGLSGMGKSPAYAIKFVTRGRAVNDLLDKPFV